MYELATYRKRTAPAVGRTAFPGAEGDQDETLQGNDLHTYALEQRHPGDLSRHGMHRSRRGAPHEVHQRESVPRRPVAQPGHPFGLRRSSVPIAGDRVGVVAIRRREPTRRYHIITPNRVLPAAPAIAERELDFVLLQPRPTSHEFRVGHCRHGVCPALGRAAVLLLTWCRPFFRWTCLAKRQKCRYRRPRGCSCHNTLEAGVRLARELRRLECIDCHCLVCGHPLLPA